MHLGPHPGEFSAGSVHALLHETWAVTPQLDRIGIRLQGPGKLHLARGGTDRPEPTAPGSVQVPPDGNPILFLADHPVVGDHPVIAVVLPADLPVAAQLGRDIGCGSSPPSRDDCETAQDTATSPGGRTTGLGPATTHSWTWLSRTVIRRSVPAGVRTSTVPVRT